VVLSRSGLTRLVDRIEAKGWIRREECPSDRRGSYAILTESGLRQREATWRVYQPLLLELWSSKLTDEDAETLIEILGKFHEPAKVPSACGG
jgi:DNA-binding MarR family transcriptional regulator